MHTYRVWLDNWSAVLVNAHTADEPVTYHPLDQLADAAGVWSGWRTREALHKLAGEMLAEVERPKGADYDRVIAEFERRRRED